VRGANDVARLKKSAILIPFIRGMLLKSTKQAGTNGGRGIFELLTSLN
jgi:hypothetical protein